MNISQRIKELRKEKGLSQADLANALKVDRTTVVKWETAKHYPDIEMLIPIADFFEVSVDYLLGRKDY